MAFLDHVYAVVGAGTADEIAQCDFLRHFGRFEVATTVADDETWTGRYLFGRGTYVELFGPEDVEGPNQGEVSTGIGLATRERGGLGIVSDRLKGGDTGLELKRRTRQEGDDQVPWFEHLSPPGDPESLSLWVMEYDDDSADLQRRESAFLEWTMQPEDAAQGPFLGDVSGVELGTTAGDISRVEPILAAAGFVVTNSRGVLVARDAETMIRLDSTAPDAVGLRSVEFVLTAAASTVQVEAIGTSTLTVGPGNRALWDFMSP